MRLLTLLLVVAFTFSCSNRIESAGPPEKVKVNFGINSDLIGPAGLLSTKALTSNDLVAVQVFERNSLESLVNRPYAYGLWDAHGDIQIELNKGNVYRFEVTVIPDGKNIIATNTDGTYKQPFSLSGTGGDSKINNRFIYSATNQFNYIGYGTAAIKNGSSYETFYRPHLQRYYGLLDNVVASDGTGSLAVTAKMVNFGLKYEIIGFAEGEIIVAIKNAPDVRLTPSDYAPKKTYYSFYGDGTSKWIDDNYTENIQLTVTWKKDAETIVVVSDKKYDFKRLNLYNLKIDLTQSSKTGGIGIVMENEELKNGGDIG